ncbi:MAG: hypothetical protein H0U82_01995 [Actinobacteria bacterium]|nr:hypothetical protein [Actinomycetota bacterium]
MRRLGLTLAIVFLGGGGALLQPTADAQPAASRVIDRTYSCSVEARAGVREVQAQANAGLRWIEDRAKWKRLAGAVVSDSVTVLGFVSAGNPLAPENGFRFPPQRLAILAGSKCRAAARIPLSRAGLSGGPASQLGDAYDCVAGSRVIVRVRGVFRGPTSLKPKRYAGGVTQLEAAGTVTQGYLAVRSGAGKPLAYAEVFESGKARLFTARGCVED